MAVFLSPVGGVAAQFFTNTGAVLTGGKLYTYLAGTTTPAATYTSAAGATFNTNPIVLDAAGRVPGSGEIWLGEGVQYKFVLKDSNDVLIGTYDNVTGINSNFVNYNALEEIQVATAGQTVFNLTNSYQPGTNTLSVFVDGVNQYDGSSYSYTETNSTTVTFTAGLHVGALVKFTTAVTLSAGVVSSNLVTYQPAGTGAVATTVQAKLRQTVSVMDFGADSTGVADSTAAFTAALTASSFVSVPSGTYKLTSSVTIPANKTIEFASTAIVNYTASSGNVFVIKNNASMFGNGATINATNASWVDAIFYLNGAEQFFVNGTIIDGFVLNGPVTTNQKGIGILLSALNAGEYVAFVRFNNINFYSLSYAVYVNMKLTGSPNDQFVNGNYFQNFITWNTAQAFYVQGAASAVSTFQGNFLTNIEYQTNNFPGGRVPFEFRDGSLDNFMVNIFVWDWVGGASSNINPIQFIGASSGNYLLSNVNPYAALPNTITDATNANTCQYVQGSIRYALLNTPTVSGLSSLGVGQVGNNTSGVASDPRIGVTQSVNAQPVQAYKHSGTNPQGWRMYYSGAVPNNTTNQFWYCEDTSAVRGYLASNGGLYNYSANNSNLSDERLKTEIELSETYLDKICAIPVKTFKYKDQTDNERNLGVIAQDVLAVAPELVNKNGFEHSKDDDTKYLSIYQTDLQYALMKALQELKADFDAYKASHP